MKLLTGALNRLPEFQQLLSAIEGGRCPVALSGVSAVHRAQFSAGVGLMTGRPVVVVCADESEGERLAKDLSAFAETPVPVLAARAFTFHNAAGVSRQWEHRRLALFRQLRRGELPFLVATVESLLQRTLPPEILAQVSIECKSGESHDLNQLCETLTAAGYVRCDQVEGVGQFALRGGILDVYGPGMEAPARMEFFGDEIDSMGRFDPETQRRTENLEEVLLLPAAEVLPQMAPGGGVGLRGKLERLAAKGEKNGQRELAALLREDGEAVAQGRTFPAIDRYLPLIYPELKTAADYFPEDACVIISECVRVAERAKTYLWQLEEDSKTLLERGELDGSCTELAKPFSRLCGELENWACAYFDTFTTASYPTPPECCCPSPPSSSPPSGAALRRRCRISATIKTPALPQWCWSPESSGRWICKISCGSSG